MESSSDAFQRTASVEDLPESMGTLQAEKEGGTEEEEKRKREEKLGERDRKREEKVLAVKTWPLIAILQRLNKGQRN